MTSLQIWVKGARPKTLTAAIAPVLVGSSIAYSEKSFNLLIAFLALTVSISIQIAVNYANDYSDGIKGTDNKRVGPIRLVGQNLASAKSVRNASFIFFFIAAVAGLVITISTKQWWFLLLGFSAIISAWTYTGGPKPYGYAGFGEVFVFIYFGLVAVLGTIYAQTLSLKPYFYIYAISIGCFAAAILVANNLRDREKDQQSNKMTLAVKLGDTKTRYLFVILMLLPFIFGLLLLVTRDLGDSQNLNFGGLLSFLALPLAINTIRPVLQKVSGKDLIQTLVNTGKTEFIWAVMICLGIIFQTN